MHGKLCLEICFSLDKFGKHVTQCDAGYNYGRCTHERTHSSQEGKRDEYKTSLAIIMWSKYVKKMFTSGRKHENLYFGVLDHADSK